MRTRKMNPIEQYFRMIMKKRNLDRKKLAEKLFVTVPSMEHQLRRPWYCWNLGQLMEYCRVYDVPIDCVMMVALQCMQEEKDRERYG